MPDRKRRIAAGLLLAAGAGAAAAASQWLVVEGEDITRRPAAAPPLIAFAACFAMAFAAGRLARGADAPEAPEPIEPPAPVRWSRRIVAGAVALLAAALFARCWSLQARVRVPLEALALWGASLAAGAAAFAFVSGRRPTRRAARAPVALAAALVAVLATGIWCRLAALESSPAAFGGDEANQVTDGIGLIRGVSEADPFGIGWGGTVHLGMLPAGVGALSSEDPIAGPRRPYAIAGALCLAASAAAAGLIGGGWAALAAAALLAFLPHHVHFSRLASVMVLDSLFAMTFVVLALAARRTGSPAAAFLAAAAAGLSLYGYVGGRLVPVALLAAAPMLVASHGARSRRLLVALALIAGFALAAGPNLRFAAHHWNEWNSRFNQTNIFRADWWIPKLHELGSPWNILKEQFVAGTVSLLGARSQWAWFTGYPIAAPAFLPALAVAGLGWLLGGGWLFEALLPGLLVAGNLAAVMLTDSAPAPQRLSSLFPALAVLGGAAVSGFVSLWRQPVPRRAGDRGALVGSVLVGGILLGAFQGFPPWWDPSPGYGQTTAAFLRSAAGALRAPRYRGERVYLEGLPYVDSNFPLCGYLLPEIRWLDRDPAAAGRSFEPGWHLFSPELGESARQWASRLGSVRVVALADPWDPRRDVGWLLRAP